MFAEPVGATKESFSFNASHISAEQLTEVKHDFELKNEPFTFFNIDAKFNPISESDELNFNEKHIEFDFNIRPVNM